MPASHPETLCVKSAFDDIPGSFCHPGGRGVINGVPPSPPPSATSGQNGPEDRAALESPEPCGWGGGASWWAGHPSDRARLYGGGEGVDPPPRKVGRPHPTPPTWAVRPQILSRRKSWRSQKSRKGWGQSPIGGGHGTP